MGLRERDSVLDRGMPSERGKPCGTRDTSLHGSSAPIYVRVRDLRDPAAGNSHASSAVSVIIGGDFIDRGEVFKLGFGGELRL